MFYITCTCTYNIIHTYVHTYLSFSFQRSIGLASCVQEQGSEEQENTGGIHLAWLLCLQTLYVCTCSYMRTYIHACILYINTYIQSTIYVEVGHWPFLNNQQSIIWPCKYFCSPCDWWSMQGFHNDVVIVWNDKLN